MIALWKADTLLHNVAMKAYQFADPAKGLELKDLPVPELGPEQVLIAVEAAGLCHTDLHITKGHGDA
jgi:propanol-preferring alcohol dehydrogenase